MADDSIFGVKQEHKLHPATQGSREEDRFREGSIGFERVDGQRLYKGTGGPLSMGAKPRFKNTGGGNVNTARARRRTLSK